MSLPWQAWWPRDRRGVCLLLTAPILGLVAWRAVRAVFDRRYAADRGMWTDILTYPRETQSLSTSKHSTVAPYHGSIVPGARDVATPFGSIRVYEWGPEDGRKVLFVHGISTPSIILAGLAQQLVDRGCRVMLIDLFGRGHSDAPDPDRYPQDVRLWTSQILLVLASSPLAWTGQDGRFAMVGYSMGGGIAASFVAQLPHLVRSLIVIAPAGLMRPSRFARQGGSAAGSWLPDWIVEKLVHRRLTQINTNPGLQDRQATNGEPVNLVDVVQAELPSVRLTQKPDPKKGLWPGMVDSTMSEVVMWQLNEHRGFTKCFISSLRHAPIMNQHKRWAQIARQQDQVEEAIGGHMKGSTGLDEGRMLLILGTKDDVIDYSETAADAIAAMGSTRVKLVSLEADHGVPSSHARECAVAMSHFWNEACI